ncbi:MAG: hypothetical protein JXB47_02070 [Anaerolineae bacterium]|nr:hypothetical protein [Anaerolineae bacterium]
MVSHELRTPLGAIKGYTTTLIDYADRLPPEKQLELLEIIDRATDNLTHMIKDLIDLSRIQAGRLQVIKEPVDLGRVIRRVCGDATVLAPERRVSIDIAGDVPDRAPADPERFRQIIANLVNNANKHTPPGTPVAIQVLRAGDDVLVQVADQGPGIAPEHHDKIFDYFYRVPGPDDWNHRGVGLGLAICRGLVEGHGGRIWVDSRPGAGTRFSFTLPLSF